MSLEETRQQLLTLNILHQEMSRYLDWEQKYTDTNKKIDSLKREIEDDNPSWIVWRVQRSYVLSPMGKEQKS